MNQFNSYTFYYKRNVCWWLYAVTHKNALELEVLPWNENNF